MYGICWEFFSPFILLRSFFWRSILWLYFTVPFCIIFSFVFIRFHIEFYEWAFCARFLCSLYFDNWIFYEHNKKKAQVNETLSIRVSGVRSIQSLRSYNIWFACVMWLFFYKLNSFAETQKISKFHGMEAIILWFNFSGHFIVVHPFTFFL